MEQVDPGAFVRSTGLPNKRGDRMHYRIRIIGICIQSGVEMPLITDAAEPIGRFWLWTDAALSGEPRWVI